MPLKLEFQTKNQKLVTCNSEFDRSLSLTPNFSWVLVNDRSIATVLTVLRFVDVAKLLKQFGDSPHTPLKRGVNESTRIKAISNETLGRRGGTTDFNVTGH